MYGIATLSIIPVRKEPIERSELVTQLLFGEAYGIVEQVSEKPWLQIKTVFDDYTGFISLNQHTEVSEAYFESYQHQTHTVCYDDVAHIESKNGPQLLTLGATLPFLKGRELRIGQTTYTYEGAYFSNQNEDVYEQIRFYMLRFLNVPYLWGGRSVFGIDCSGYVQLIYKLMGYQLLRDAYQQATQGMEIANLQDATTGDMVFFENDEGRIIHVGLILDKNSIIHAHGHVRIDIVDEKGIFNLTSKKYSHKFCKIKRIL